LKNKSAQNLLVLSTYKVSLTNWEKSGLLSREIGYYQLMKALYKINISFITYDANDKKFINKYKGIDILFKKYINNSLFSIFAPIIYFNAFLKSDIIKSNQSKGAWTGLVAKFLFRNKKLIVRCGWVRTEEMMKKVELKTGFKYYIESFLEKLSFRFSDAIIVTTELDKKYLMEYRDINEKKIHIIPNSVDIKLFKRIKPRPWGNQLKVISVGRFVKSKNYESLIIACNESKYVRELILIGDGAQKYIYNDIAEKIDTKITFISNIKNNSIPNYLKKADLFIMPQKYGSGMSKVIMESMSLGLLTIASDIPAHTQSIIDGVDGFICGKSPQSIKACIKKIFKMSESERIIIRKNASNKIINEFSFNKSLEKEFSLYNRLLR
jgi:glycosyltransferase involved in cell wall biosynthesis